MYGEMEALCWYPAFTLLQEGLHITIFFLVSVSVSEIVPRSLYAPDIWSHGMNNFILLLCTGHVWRTPILGFAFMKMKLLSILFLLILLELLMALTAF